MLRACADPATTVWSPACARLGAGGAYSSEESFSVMGDARLRRISGGKTLWRQTGVPDGTNSRNPDL